MEGERTSDRYIPPVYPKRRQIDLDTPRLNCPMAFARGFDPTERHALRSQIGSLCLLF